MVAEARRAWGRRVRASMGMEMRMEMATQVEQAMKFLVIKPVPPPRSIIV